MNSQKKYGKDPSNIDYIKNLYQNVLNRDPDIIGQSYWLGKLNEGLEDRTELLIGFSESEENKKYVFNRNKYFLNILLLTSERNFLK